MPNPYVAGSPEAFEYDVWERGQVAGGRERDFLRAFHTEQGILDLQTCIQSATSAKTRVTSLWIDRYPIARPHPPSTSDARELADLAVVVRVLGPAGLGQRMFLVQGKVDSPSWQSKGSSPKEIDFLEKAPVFDLFTSAQRHAKPLGRFNLQADFGPPPYAGIPFWAYLLLAPSSAHAATPSPSHAYAAWTSLVTTCEPFFFCVIEQARACMAGSSMTSGISSSLPPWGADVHRGTPCTEWRRLYVTLAYHVHRKLASKLTGGAWKNIAPFALPWEPVSLVAGGHGGTLGLISTGFTTQVGNAVSLHDNRLDFFCAEIGEWNDADHRRIVHADPYTTDDHRDGDGPGLPGDHAEDDGPGFGMLFVDVVGPLDDRRA